MKSEMFPCRAILSCALDEKFFKVPLLQETLTDLKNYWLRLWDIKGIVKKAETCKFDSGLVLIFDTHRRLSAIISLNKFM